MTVIKILLILAGIGLAIFLLRGHGTNRGGAYVKIGMVVFLAFAAYAVIRPDDVTWVATRLGVGRGADLVLYVLVVGFGFFAINTYLRFRELELKIARLARVVALNEAEQADRIAQRPHAGADRTSESRSTQGPPDLEGPAA